MYGRKSLTGLNKMHSRPNNIINPTATIMRVANPNKTAKKSQMIPTSIKRVTPSRKLAHLLRLAVHEGGSSNPRDNPKLKRCIKLALDQDMPLLLIERTIRCCDQPQNKDNTYLLQLRYQRRISLICCVYTESLSDLKRQMMPMLRKYGATFAYVLHHFDNCGYIEAIISPRTPVEFGDLEGAIQKDTIACKAMQMEVLDYRTGAILFKCETMELSNVSKALESKGYKLLHTEFAFTAKKPVRLHWQEEEGYRRFLYRLRQVPNVLQINDNVICNMDEMEEWPVDE